MNNELENKKHDGWDSITKEFERIYPMQKNPKHYGTLINWEFGSNEPLRGISVYDDNDCWHFVSYGLTELFEKESENPEISGFGMEFTLRLKKYNYDNEEEEIKNICGILQSLAKITFNNKEIFKPYEYIYTGQKEGIDVKQKSNITGFITIPDVKAKTIETSNGRVEFVELIGVTNDELEAIINKKITVKGLYEKLNTDITDYSRKSIYNVDSKQEIIISERIYKGKLAPGQLIEKKFMFNYSNEKSTIELIEIKYPNSQTIKRESLIISDKNKFFEILSELKTNYLYSEEIDNSRNIPQRLNYVDIYINGIHIEIGKENNLLLELKEIIGINLFDN